MNLKLTFKIFVILHLKFININKISLKNQMFIHGLNFYIFMFLYFF